MQLFEDNYIITHADSNVMPKNSNIGYPGSAEEIDTFFRQNIFAKKNISTIEEYLKTNAPKY